MSERASPSDEVEAPVESVLDAEQRHRLVEIADELIPAGDGMPAPSVVGVADGQLAVVLGGRPDLFEPLSRVLSMSFEGTVIDFMEAIEVADPEGHGALVLTILGGYYMSEQVSRLLGYTGQRATPVSPDTYPLYVEEGLLEAVTERGWIFRPTPD
jgi:hypothetical protein